jgi:hypothetical protein
MNRPIVAHDAQLLFLFRLLFTDGAVRRQDFISVFIQPIEVVHHLLVVRAIRVAWLTAKLRGCEAWPAAAHRSCGVIGKVP